MIDVERLKQKILDLAIRGQLVPQDPNDEPASVLIDKIRAEKESLIKQGKIKRDKNESYIYKGDDNSYYEKVYGETKKIDVPFEIPNSWSWCRVSSISNYGKNIIANDKDIKSTDWVLELEEIESYTSTLINKKTKGTKPLGSTKHKFQKGDLLLSKLRMYLKKVIIANDNGFCTTEILALNFEPYCLNEYACMFFISPYLLKKVEQLQYGCKMPRLGTKDGKELLIPIPPKNEQMRIMESYRKLLSNIELLRDNYREIYSLAEKLKYRILDMFFGIDSRYKSYYEYEEKRLSNIATLITKGSTPTTYGFNYLSDGINFIKVENVKDYSVQHDTIKQFISKEAHEFQKRSQLEKDDLLISIAGTLGRICLIKDEDLPANTNQAFAIVRGYTQSILPDYLKWFMTWYVASKYQQLGHGGGMNNLTLNEIKDLRISFPVSTEEQQIVDKINSYLEIISAMQGA